MSISPMKNGGSGGSSSSIFPESKPSRFRRFCAKVEHSIEKIDLMKKWERSLFGNNIIGNLRNITKKIDIERGDDVIATQELLKKCLLLKKIKMISHVNIKSSIDESHIEYSGICAGVRLDIACQLIRENVPLKKVIKANELGGSAQAAANQAVFQSISKSDTSSNIYDNLMNILEKIPKNTRFKGASLKNILKYMTSDDPIAFLTIEKERIGKLHDSPHKTLKLAIVNEELQWVKSLLEFSEGLDEAFHSNDPEALVKEVHFKAIKNPVIRYQIKMLLAGEPISNNPYLVTAKARGLTLESTIPVMGQHAFFASDRDYLKNLNKLSPGVYCVDFDSNGSHAITLIKNKNGENHIIDPNGFVIKSQGDDDLINQFHKLLSLYDQPKAKHPEHSRANGPDHHITIHKFRPFIP